MKGDTSTDRDRELVGFVPVDSGTIWVGDPCHVSDGFDWNHWCLRSDEAGQAPAFEFRTGQGIHGFGGDGRYPVYVDLEDGLVARVVIEFDPHRCEEVKP